MRDSSIETDFQPERRSDDLELEAALVEVVRRLRQDGFAAADLEDAVQEAAFRFWINRRAVRSPRTWLLVVARRLAFRDADRSKRERELADSLLQHGRYAESPAAASIDRLALGRALRCLGRNLRRFVVLHFIHGLTSRDAAERAGYSPNSAKALTTRSLKKLRAALSPRNSRQ